MRHPLPEVQEDRDWWLLARDAVWGGLESSGNVVGGTGCPQATPSLPPREGTGPTVMPFVLALGLGAAVLSEEQGAITRTRRHGAERS